MPLADALGRCPWQMPFADALVIFPWQVPLADALGNPRNIMHALSGAEDVRNGRKADIVTALHKVTKGA